MSGKQEDAKATWSPAFRSARHKRPLFIGLFLPRGPGLLLGPQVQSDAPFPPSGTDKVVA